MNNYMEVSDMANTGILKEYAMSVNDFKQPAEAKGKKAIGVLIVRLLLMEKGTDPMRPDMGVGIRSRYRFAFESELTSLQEDIETQISTYLPEVSPVTVKVALENDRNDILKNKIKISIIIDETEYLLSYDVTSNTLEGIKFR